MAVTCQVGTPFPCLTVFRDLLTEFSRSDERAASRASDG